MDNTRILAICPYEGMRELIANVASRREDIALSAFVGDLHEGLEIAKREVETGKYDIILSRGGTAEMISKAVDIPLLEIPISMGDVLQVIKLAENYKEKFAIMGFPGITGSAKLVCDLLQYSIDIYTIHDLDKVPDMLHQLGRDGYTMVLCDMITTTVARSVGLNSVLITSGVESIENAFSQAVKLNRSYAGMKRRNRLLEAAVKAKRTDTAVFDLSGAALLSTLDDSVQGRKLQAAAHRLARQYRDQTPQQFDRLVGGRRYTLTASMLQMDKEEAVMIALDTSNEYPASETGVRFMGYQDIDTDQFIDYYSTSNSVGSVRNIITEFSRTDFPVLILGEEGTGKNAAAIYLYANGPYANRSLCLVDCGKIGEKAWNNLLESPDSPLNDISRTIFFKEMDKMSGKMAGEFCTLLGSTKLCSRNRILCSFVTGDSAAPEHPACKCLVNDHSCLVLYLPPLRERLGDISSLSALYINQFDLKYGKQITGFEPGAIECLVRYSWPGNLHQFKRVLQELVMTTTQYYIPEEAVSAALKKESALFHPKTAAGAAGIDLGKTLEEINYDIVRLVMEQEGGSPQKTAARLGISRSTVWRMLRSKGGA